MANEMAQENLMDRPADQPAEEMAAGTSEVQEWYGTTPVKRVQSLGRAQLELYAQQQQQQEEANWWAR